MSVTVAVDAMGGDHGPAVTVPACVEFLEGKPHASVVLVGLRQPLEALLATVKPAVRARISIHPATEVVDMDEPPADALRKKKDSSMRVAINLVKDEVAQACVSAGNTGALMAISRFVLKTLPGIDRPAIAAQLPTRTGVVTVLDLGANVNCSPEQLVQFAVMGTALVAAMDGVERPTIGLLNVGEEEIKGNELAKQTGELLRASGLNFHGNVEGNDIFKGTTQVVICDGFVGNVALKASEGLVTMLYGMLREEFTRNLFTRLVALVATPVLRAFKRRVDPRRHNGATLIGLKGVVVKSHGSADVLAFQHALRKAYTEATHGILDKIAQRMAAMPSTVSTPATAEATSGDA